MAAYLQRRADGQKADQRCSIDREENNDLPQTRAERRRSIEEPSLMRLLLAICLEEGEEARVFWARRRRRQRKLWPMKRIQCRWGDL